MNKTIKDKLSLKYLKVTKIKVSPKIKDTAF